ncbi:hypothetical protein FJZ31_01375 [Candidatus Poribacteria bacterium]|nr:hypothetical protein [Candidatus Poribacteria bacterium]
MRIKYHQAAKLLHKLGFKPPEMSHHKQYIFEYNDQIIIRAYYSHGSGDMFASLTNDFVLWKATNKFRTSLKLNEKQFRDAIRCPFEFEDYIALLRAKGYITSEDNPDFTSKAEYE